MRQSPRNLGWMLLAARLHGGVTIRSLGRGAAMSDDPVRPAASTAEALYAIIADAFSRGDVGAFLAAHEEGASVVVPPGGTCAHGLAEIRATSWRSPMPAGTSTAPRRTAPARGRAEPAPSSRAAARTGLGGSCSTIRRAGPLRQPHVSFMEGPDPRPWNRSRVIGLLDLPSRLPRPAVAARAVPCVFLRVQPAGPGLGSWAPRGELWLVVGWPRRQPSAPASPASGPAAHVPQHS